MHRILERQIKRYIGSAEKLPAELRPLFEAIDEVYRHADEDRALLDRSLELSSREFMDINRSLREENVRIDRLVQKRTQDLEKEKEKLAVVAENMLVGVMLLDHSGKAVFANRIVETMADVRGNPEQALAALLPFFPELPEAISACRAGKDVALPNVEVGNSVYSIFLRPVSSGSNAPLQLISITNITEAKRVERLKDEFIAIASHEMRTPLAIIRGQAELLIESVSNQEDVAMLESVRNNSVRLLNIVNDFLDIARLEGNKLAFRKEPVDLLRLVEEVCHELEKSAKKKNLLLRYVPSPQTPLVLADTERAKQAIMDIVSNAVYYTNAGEIVVTFQSLPEAWKVTVQDTGIGIDPSQQPFLFQKFHTANREFLKSRTHGSGMGLYITKMLTENMGGDVRLESSELGKGSVFSITLPMAPPS